MTLLKTMLQLISGLDQGKLFHPYILIQNITAYAKCLEKNMSVFIQPIKVNFCIHTTVKIYSRTPVKSILKKILRKLSKNFQISRKPKDLSAFCIRVMYSIFHQSVGISSNPYRKVAH